MIEKNDVIEFFNHCAPSWDEGMIRKEEIIELILDRAGIGRGIDVLDVACGTGVLFPDYIKRGVNSVTGVDISPVMAEIASAKFNDDRIKVICADVEETEFEHEFDTVMVYNAFPHFPDPARLIYVLSKKLKAGGRLTIAHSMSREQLDRHHSGAASKVSAGLMHENELKKLFEPYFDVDVVISNDEMYEVSGTKKYA